MTAATSPHGYHHIDPKTGVRTWVGPTRGEVLHYREQLEVCRVALAAVVALSTQGSVCEVANRALEKTR